jgi:hypothetical protein
MGSEHNVAPRKKNVLKASGWMLGLSVGLVWLPVLGPLIAGFVGGRKAGGVGPAILAVFLPGIMLFVISILLGGLLVNLPILGGIFASMFAFAGSLVSLMQIGPLVVGAVLGGWTSD